MQLSNNTSTLKSKSLLIKAVLIIAIITSAIIMLNKIDFPSPNKEIEKIIPNAKLKIVK
tara:strand:+ start:734 stop:910 length:177 start_codon:yes stop_codon:yes gene_type:complete